MPAIIKSTKKYYSGGKKQPALKDKPPGKPIDPACRRAIAAFIDRVNY